MIGTRKRAPGPIWTVLLSRLGVTWSFLSCLPAIMRSTRHSSHHTGLLKCAYLPPSFKFELVVNSKDIVTTPLALLYHDALAG
jgi:hypothetical protein